MKNDIDTVRQAISIYPFTVNGVFDLPDPMQVATIAAILETSDKPASECVLDAVLLIAESKRVLKEIRVDAASDKFKWNSMTLDNAAEEIGLSKKTIKKHAAEIGLEVDGDEITKQGVAEIKKRFQKAKKDRANAGFKASGFKGKKRKTKKS